MNASAVPLHTYMVVMANEYNVIVRHPCLSTDMESAAHIVSRENAEHTFIKVEYTH